MLFVPIGGNWISFWNYYFLCSRSNYPWSWISECVCIATVNTKVVKVMLVLGEKEKKMTTLCLGISIPILNHLAARALFPGDTAAYGATLRLCRVHSAITETGSRRSRRLKIRVVVNDKVLGSGALDKVE